MESYKILIWLWQLKWLVYRKELIKSALWFSLSFFLFLYLLYFGFFTLYFFIFYLLSFVFYLFIFLSYYPIILLSCYLVILLSCYFFLPLFFFYFFNLIISVHFPCFLFCFLLFLLLSSFFPFIKKISRWQPGLSHSYAFNDQIFSNVFLCRLWPGLFLFPLLWFKQLLFGGIF